MQSIVRPVHGFRPVSRWFAVLALVAAVVAVALIVRDSRSGAPRATGFVQPVPVRALQLAAGKSTTAPGAVAILKRGNTLLVASIAGKGRAIRLVERHASLQSTKGGPRHMEIHTHAGPTVRLAAGGSAYYVRSGTRTWRLTGYRIQPVSASKLRPAVARQLSGTAALGGVWIAAHQRLLAVSVSGSRHAVPVGPSSLSKLHGFNPANGAPVVAAGSIWVTQSATGQNGKALGYLQRVHRAGGAIGAPIALGHGTPVLALTAGGRIWVVTDTGRRHNLIWQIDPARGRVLDSTPLPASWLPRVGYGDPATLWLAGSGRLIRFTVS